MASLSTSSHSKNHLFQSSHCFPFLSAPVIQSPLQEGCAALILKESKYQDPFSMATLHLKQKFGLQFTQFISWLLSLFPNCLHMSLSWCAGSANTAVCITEKKIWVHAKCRCKHTYFTVGRNRMQKPAWLHVPVCNKIETDISRTNY